MEEKELLETILATDILILAKTMAVMRKQDGVGGSDPIESALYEIKTKRSELIQRLIRMH